MGTSFFKILSHESFKSGEEFNPEIKIPLPVDQRAHLLIKPNEYSLTDYIPVKESSSLTIFTYTVKSGFSEVVKNHIANCDGNVVLVFSYTDDAKKGCVCQDIVDSLEASNIKSLKVYISKTSHIKLFQRDNHLIIGSQNFSIGNDGEYSKDELLIEYKDGGKEVAEHILNYFTKIDPFFEPIEAKGLNSVQLKNRIEDILSKIGEEKRIPIEVHKKNLVEHIYNHFSLKYNNESDFNFNDYHPSNSEFKEDFLNGLRAACPSVFEPKVIIDELDDMFSDLYDKTSELLDDLTPSLDIHDLATDKAHNELCENGFSDPEDADKYMTDGHPELICDLIKKKTLIIEKENKRIILSFMKQFNILFHSKIKELAM